MPQCEGPPAARSGPFLWKRVITNCNIHFYYLIFVIKILTKSASYPKFTQSYQQVCTRKGLLCRTLQESVKQ